MRRLNIGEGGLITDQSKNTGMKFIEHKHSWVIDFIKSDRFSIRRKKRVETESRSNKFDKIWDLTVTSIFPVQ